jgi:hypothetical protein
MIKEPEKYPCYPPSMNLHFEGITDLYKLFRVTGDARGEIFYNVLYFKDLDLIFWHYVHVSKCTYISLVKKFNTELNGI